MKLSKSKKFNIRTNEKSIDNIKRISNVTNRSNEKQAPLAHDEHANIDQLIVELRKLKPLVDEGIITEEEFKEKKKQLLGINAES